MKRGMEGGGRYLSAASNLISLEQSGEWIGGGSEPAHYCSGRNTMHPRTAFSTQPTRASPGYSGLNRASSPLSRVSRELPRGLLADCVPLNGGIRFGEGEARNWYASAFPIREALGRR